MRLATQLGICGPIADEGAAERCFEVLAAALGPLPDDLTPKLAPILGASPYLAGLMRKDPDRLARLLDAEPDAAFQQILTDTAATQTLGLDAAMIALRRLKAETHLLTALCDLGGVWGLDQVTCALTRFADVSLGAALSLAVAQERQKDRLLPAAASGACDAPGFFCLAMGKMGAFELNYSSDIDISIFYEPERLPVAEGVEPQAVALRLARQVSEILSRRTDEGYVFRVDLRLRPDPSSTPAAMPVVAALDYYETVGQNWERAAMIKARVAAGDFEAGAAFLRELQPFVWRRSLDYAAVADIHAIKRQIHTYKVDDRLTPPGANLKLGRGGIREIEFFVQTQQLILGGRDARLRAPRTLEALEALRAAGHVSDDAADELRLAYPKLRDWEHRVQMLEDEQTHILPVAPEARNRVAALAGQDLASFDTQVEQVMRGVNRRYGALFSEDEPLSSAFGSLVFTGVENDPETLLTLGRMGFSHPEQVAETIRSWHHGRIAATRTARGRELFTRLAPQLLDAAAATGAPDAAFVRFADFFASLSSGVQIQSLFLAQPALFRLIVEVMAFAPELARTLARRPAAIDALVDGDFFTPVTPEDASATLKAAVNSAKGFEAVLDAARRAHHDQSFRIGVQVMSGMAAPEEAGAAFAALADACLASLAPKALEETVRLGGAFAGDVAIVFLGKAGSREMSARSDLDLMTLYAAEPNQVSSAKGWTAETFYARFTQRLIAALSAPTAEGVLYPVDMRLRPSGTAGPVAVRLSAMEAYYRQEAQTWEFLALTRARVAWASSPAFAKACQDAITAGLTLRRSSDTVRQDVREMRALMRRERPAYGFWDLKLSDGGLVDIEFIAQTLQLFGAADGGELTVSTGNALAIAAAEGRLPPEAERVLSAALRLHQSLTQLVKLALTEPENPEAEPERFKALLARAARRPSFSDLVASLTHARTEVVAWRRRILAED